MSLLRQYWKQAGKDLGFEVEAPFQVCLPNAGSITVDLLVKNFGAKNGMLIVTDFNKISDFADYLVNNMGYGYSTLSDYNVGDPYIQEDLVEVLQDWGWTGDPAKQPSWLNSR